MELTATYSLAFTGILLILTTWCAQGFVAAVSKGSQRGAVPGRICPDLSHDSFVFRAHRTFMNSLENVPLMLGTSFLAILIGVNPFWTGVLITAFALFRIIHTALYYLIATEKNPSPRSYFFLIAWIANIALLVMCALKLL